MYRLGIYRKIGKAAVSVLMELFDFIMAGERGTLYEQSQQNRDPKNRSNQITRLIMDQS